MFCVKMVAPLIVVVGIASGLAASENAAVAGLRNAIQTLRAEQKIVIKTIHVQYDTMVKRDKVAEHVLEEERRALSIQEKNLLAVATTSEQKESIRLQYETLRAALKTDGKLDARQITELRRYESAHIKYVEMAYNAKIKMLEAEIKAVEQASKVRR